MLGSTQTTYSPHPAQRAYQPRGAALELFYSKLPELVLSGPAGTGKSRACLEKLHLCALKYRRMRGLIIRKTRESLSEAALVTFEDKVLHEYDPIKDGSRRNFRQAYHYPNGSEVVVGGLDKPGKIMSTEYDLIYVQEATELELGDWLALTTRLRNNVMPYQQLIADCNPDAPTHWLWVRAQSDALTMLHSRHEDNPRLWQGGRWTDEGLSYLATLDRLTGTEHQRLRLGQWVQASGMVFDVWADPGNVTEDAKYTPDAGPVLWALDDGYSAGSAPQTAGRDPKTGYYVADSHPRVMLLVQQRDDGRLCVFAEDYACLKLSDTHIAEVLALPYPAPDVVTHGPGAAEIRGRVFAANLTPHQSTADVEESIKELRRALAPDANGWRRVLVHPRCVQLRAEMASYRRDAATGKVVKQFDHGPDALRGLVWILRHV
jgi:phage terminase large subunit